jgi:hypothetical protein
MNRELQSGNLKGGDNLGDIGVDGIAVLKWIIKE